MFEGETSDRLTASASGGGIGGHCRVREGRRVHCHAIGVLREHTRVVSDLAHDGGSGGDRDCDGCGSAEPVVGVC